MRSRQLLLCLALPLAACAGPRVETAKVPPPEPPAAWRTGIGEAEPLPDRWWEGFGDPVLSTLIDRALANNPDVEIAAARIRDARAQQALARAALLPTIEASASGSEARSVSVFGSGIEQAAGQPQVQAAWEADLFGRLSDQQSAARSTWLASRAAHDAARLSVAATVANGYIALAALDARLVITRQTLEVRSKSLQITSRRARAGYATQLEQAQAEAEYQAAAQLVPSLELGIAKQENALAILTGVLPSGTNRGKKLSEISQPKAPASLPSELLRHRPDIAQAELQLAAADSSLAAARKRYLPQVRLSAAIGASLSSRLADPISIWSLGGSILAPLFEGGRVRATAESAGAQRDVAAFTYRKAALNAFREVEDVMAAVARNDEQVTIVQAQRDALAQAYQLASRRYAEGYSPLLEMLDAQRGLLSAELSLVQAKADALSARVTLYQALGGGWEGLGDG